MIIANPFLEKVCKDVVTANLAGRFPTRVDSGQVDSARPDLDQA
jgi:hypothetical protein